MESLAALETAAKAKEALGLLNTARLAIAKRRYPRPRSNSTGILIAISTENELNRQKVNNDFLKTLREIVGVQEMDKRFEIVELPWYHLEKIKTIDDAKSVIEKCNCKFMLWGVVKEREIDKKPYIVFDVRSLAFHGEIVQELSDVLSQEMALLLPRRVLVSKDNDLLEIEFNAVNTALACQYIIAETAYLSGEEDFALDLFERLAEEVGKMNLAPLPERLRSHIQLLQKKIQLCRVAIHIRRANQKNLLWRTGRRPDGADAMIAETKKVDALLPGTYQSALNWSIFHFLQGDLQTARKILGSWSSHPDGTWALNIAFLYLYEGKTREANRYYQIAFRRNLESNTVLEVEEFMEWCLKDDKSKVQLNYGLGMVNYVLKEEPDIARDYFNRFLDEVMPGQFIEAAVQATKYREDIRNKKPARIKKIP